MAEGALDDATLTPTPKPRRGWSTRAATTGASRSTRRCTGSGSATSTWTGAGDLLGRRADARVAGAGAGRRPRPAAARRAHQPPRHRVARVAGDAPAAARRGDRPGGARPLVPRGRRHLGAGARGRALEVLQGHLARLAGREGAAGAGAGPGDREAAGGDRQARALRRPASAPARAPGRRPRARRSSTRWSGSRATRRTARAWASRSSRPSARAAWSSRSRTGC